MGKAVAAAMSLSLTSQGVPLEAAKVEKSMRKAQAGVQAVPRRVTLWSLTSQEVHSEEAQVLSLDKESQQAYQEHLLEPSGLMLQRRKVVAEMKEVKSTLRPVSKKMTPRVSSKTISVCPN